MRLDALRSHWERLGRRDPYWAVLTTPHKAGGQWNPDEFFQSGVAEVERVLRRADALGLGVSRRRALDFGCGVGRITQALAAEFERTDGVDIAASMLEAAARQNRHGSRCVYHLNTAPDLALFEDGTFTFVYSTIVLQHMEPRFAKVYMREFLRVLAPGGLAVFQVPSRRAAHDPPPGASLTEVPGRLPAAAFRARLAVEAPRLSLEAGKDATLTVTVENVSACTWPALGDNRGRYPINLANCWFSEAGEPLTRNDGRCPLPYDLEPGAKADLMLGIRAPQHDGTYLLELDLVQENVSWFGERGSERLRVLVNVTGGLPSADRPRPAWSAWHRSRHAPFRDRHPGLYRFLRATRLRDLYWTWRTVVFEPLLAPTINWWRGQPFAPKMEMHCVPRADVVAVVAAGGAELVDTEEELLPGGFTSCRYWVLKAVR